MEDWRAFLSKLISLQEKGIPIRPLFQKIIKKTEFQLKKKKVGGRPRKLDDKKIEEARRLMQDPRYSITHICQIFGVSRSTLYRSIKRFMEEEKNTQRSEGTCINQSSNLPNRIYKSQNERVIGMGCGDCGKSKVNGQDDTLKVLQIAPVSECQVRNIPRGFVSALDIEQATVIINSDLACRIVERTEDCVLTCANGRTLVVPVTVSDVFLTGSIRYLASVPIKSSSELGSCDYPGIGFIPSYNTFCVDVLVCEGVQGFTCPEGPICLTGTPTVVATELTEACNSAFEVTVTVPLETNIICPE